MTFCLCECGNGEGCFKISRQNRRTLIYIYTRSETALLPMPSSSLIQAARTLTLPRSEGQCFWPWGTVLLLAHHTHLLLPSRLALPCSFESLPRDFILSSPFFQWFPFCIWSLLNHLSQINGKQPKKIPVGKMRHVLCFYLATHSWDVAEKGQETPFVSLGSQGKSTAFWRGPRVLPGLGPAGPFFPAAGLWRRG